MYPLLLYSNNGCRIYVDIMTMEKLSLIQLTWNSFIGQSSLSSSNGGNVVMELDGGIDILASCVFHVIRVDENMV